MKKVLLTAAVLFTTCAVSAQTSVVKEAKSSKSDPVKAAQIIEPALSDPTTANDPETLKHGNLPVISRRLSTMTRI